MNRGVRVGLILLTGLAVASRADKPERTLGHEQVSGWSTNAFEHIQYGLLLEVEAFAAKKGGANQSDILLATAAFDVEAAANSWLLGHVGLLWEQYSRETDNLDEAYIILGGNDVTPFHLVAGRFYQPIGSFETVFISDPLPLELAEMNQVAAMGSYAVSWIDLNLGVFRGDAKAGAQPGEGGDTTLSDVFASVAITPVEPLQFGVYWLSDLMETYGLRDVGDAIAGLPGYERAGAAGGFINSYLGPLTVNAEYVSATGEYELSNGRYRPAAFSLEGSVRVREQVVIGLRYEGSDDLYAAYDRAVLSFGEKFPARSYGVVASYEFDEHAVIAAEYLHLEGLDDGARGDLVTVQLALAL